MKTWPVLALAFAAALLVLFPGRRSEAAPAGPADARAFQDCPQCPVMVRVPAGTFRMGSDSARARADEKPVHAVTVPAFAAGAYEVTQAEFAAFVSATGYAVPAGCQTDRDLTGRWRFYPDATWRDPGFPTGERLPVVCVSWTDAMAYTAWLSTRTGKHYRLLSEAEWEYADRAGSTTEYPWGEDPDQMCKFANGPDLAAANTFGWTGGADCDDGHDLAAPVGSYAPNAFGLHDMAGNAWEWTEDCYAPYSMQSPGGQPTERDNCARRVLKGGSWVRGLVDLRSAQRNGLPPPAIHGGDIGFRVARDL